MKTLHIIRDPHDTLAREVIQDQRSRHEVGVLFVQDGVLARWDVPGPAYACAADLTARNVSTPYSPVDYAGIVRLLEEYDRVIPW